MGCTSCGSLFFVDTKCPSFGCAGCKSETRMSRHLKMELKGNAQWKQSTHLSLEADEDPLFTCLLLQTLVLLHSIQEVNSALRVLHVLDPHVDSVQHYHPYTNWNIIITTAVHNSADLHHVQKTAGLSCIFLFIMGEITESMEFNRASTDYTNACYDF